MLDAERVAGVVSRAAGASPFHGLYQYLIDAEFGRKWLHHGWQRLEPRQARNLRDRPVIAKHEGGAIVAMYRGEREVRWEGKRAEA